MNVKTEEFEKEVLNSEIPVLVDFWADWCQPCQLMMPVFEQLSSELDGKVKICKINIEEELSFSEVFRIRNLPTIILFKNGVEVHREVGFMNKQKVKQTFSL